jgi:L-alanine-DL-glutamate epimerase-like enolase superfamily enzyme
MTIKLEYKPLNLELKYPFGISREIKYAVTNVVVKLSYEYQGKMFSGYGECAPSKFYGECPDSIIAYLKWVEDENILNTTPFDIQTINTNLNKLRYNNAAKAGIDSALYDLIGKITALPAYQYLGYAGQLPQTSYTIDISNLEMILKKTGEALMAGYNVFKVKLGTHMDEEIIFSIRQAAPDVKLRVDANAAWDLKTAIKMARVLEKYDVEFIEQPLAADNLIDLPTLRSATSLPVIVDESCTSPEDVLKLYGLVDGINIKVSKCGGLTNAIKMMTIAKTCHMIVMTGCFLETSLGIATASIIGTQSDYVDLDGCLLIKEDPYQLLNFNKARITFQNHPGITGKDLF